MIKGASDRHPNSEFIKTDIVSQSTELRKRKFDPKGTRLSDGLAVYNVQVDSDSSPKEVQVLAREEHLIGVKECMVSKMKANLARYKPTSD